MTDTEQNIALSLTLNGRPRRADVEPGTLLIDLLREGFGLLGTKRSCDSEICGACTVLLDGRPVSSCTTLALEAGGRAVLTIEGLAEGDRLHPLQRAFVEHGAVQCGFCTPGMILTAMALLADNPTPDEAAVRRGLSGNLCRCTGYKKIIEAVLSVV